MTPTPEDTALVVVIWLVGAIVGLVALYFIVRGAILSALAEDRRRAARSTAVQAPRATTHLDADGL